MDFTALATTIMAIAKEWDVLRMQDLKAKLGVLGMRWQMKVLSKTCRFFNKLGVIRYVAARLNDRIFKDCIKFVRDLDANDWSLYLATGKRSTKMNQTATPAGVDNWNETGSIMELQGNSALLNNALPWSIDMPLPASIAMAIVASNGNGLTNPDIYALTLGASFGRFVASMNTTLSTPRLQPPPLVHLQLSSEQFRTGKVASYRYIIKSNEEKIRRSWNPKREGLQPHQKSLTD